MASVCENATEFFAAFKAFHNRFYDKYRDFPKPDKAMNALAVTGAPTKIPSTHTIHAHRSSSSSNGSNTPATTVGTSSSYTPQVRAKGDIKALTSTSHPRAIEVEREKDNGAVTSAASPLKFETNFPKAPFFTSSSHSPDMHLEGDVGFPTQQESCQQSENVAVSDDPKETVNDDEKAIDCKEHAGLHKNTFDAISTYQSEITASLAGKGPSEMYNGVENTMGDNIEKLQKKNRDHNPDLFPKIGFPAAPIGKGTAEIENGIKMRADDDGQKEEFSKGTLDNQVVSSPKYKISSTPIGTTPNNMVDNTEKSDNAELKKRKNSYNLIPQHNPETHEFGNAPSPRTLSFITPGPINGSPEEDSAKDGDAVSLSESDSNCSDIVVFRRDEYHMVGPRLRPGNPAIITANPTKLMRGHRVSQYAKRSKGSSSASKEKKNEDISNSLKIGQQDSAIVDYNREMNGALASVNINTPLATFETKSNAVEKKFAAPEAENNAVGRKVATREAEANVAGWSTLTPGAKLNAVEKQVAEPEAKANAVEKQVVLREADTNAAGKNIAMSDAKSIDFDKRVVTPNGKANAVKKKKVAQSPYRHLTPEERRKELQRVQAEAIAKLEKAIQNKGRRNVDDDKPNEHLFQARQGPGTDPASRVTQQLRRPVSAEGMSEVIPYRPELTDMLRDPAEYFNPDGTRTNDDIIDSTYRPWDDYHFDSYERQFGHWFSNITKLGYPVDTSSDAFVSGNGHCDGTADPFIQDFEDGITYCLDDSDPENAHAHETAAGYSYNIRLHQVKEEAKNEVRIRIGARAGFSEVVVKKKTEIHPHAPKASAYLRPVEPKDIRQLVKIYNWYVNNSTRVVDLYETTEQEMRERITECEEGNLPFLIAAEQKSGVWNALNEEDEPIYGFITTYGFAGRRTINRYAAELELFVHPMGRRLGIGRCLMDKMLGICDPKYEAKGGYFFDCSPYRRGLYCGGYTRPISKLIFNVHHAGEDIQEYTGFKLWLGKTYGFEESGVLMGVAMKAGKSVNTGCLVYNTSIEPTTQRCPPRNS